MRKKIVLILIYSILSVNIFSAFDGNIQVKAGYKTSTMEDAASEPAIDTPTSSPTSSPKPSPSETISPSPSASATPNPEEIVDRTKFTLLNKKAKYKKSKQKGIKYKKIKGQKVYVINSFTTDTIKLTFSQKAKFDVYGGASKKEVKKKLVTVSSSGKVKAHPKKKDQKIYTLIRARSLESDKVSYIYIYFNKKLRCKTRKKITLYERYREHIRLNYAKKNLSFKIEKKETASFSKKRMNVKAIKKGKTYLVIKVKGSEKNQIKIRIKVKEEPWIVSKKDKLYDYGNMTHDLYLLARKYRGKSGLMSIGKSHDGRDIWCLRIGRANAKRKLMINASIHAREWLNTQMIMRMSEQMLREYPDYYKRYRKTCIYVLPMDNPDGVTLNQYGLKSIKNKKLRKICKKIGHFDLWKANARGVNLNNNFPSGWKKVKEYSAKKPHYMNYYGKKAGSEKETKAIMKFIKRISPSAVLNIHSTGSIIYWDFDVNDNLHKRLERLAYKANFYNEYVLMPKSASTRARGGLADWVVYGLNRASITIETGNVVCPLPFSQLKKIYEENEEFFRWFFTDY